MLVSWPGIETSSPALEGGFLTTRGVLRLHSKKAHTKSMHAGTKGKCSIWWQPDPDLPTGLGESSGQWGQRDVLLVLSGQRPNILLNVLCCRQCSCTAETLSKMSIMLLLRNLVYVCVCVCVCVCMYLLSQVWMIETPWTVAHQAPLSLGSPGKNTGVGCHLLLQGSSQPRGGNCVSCVGRQIYLSIYLSIYLYPSQVSVTIIVIFLVRKVRLEMFCDLMMSQSDYSWPLATQGLGC